MKIVAISDVHNLWHKLTIPECDVLISAGDYSSRGQPEVVEAFHKWMDKQPADVLVSVQGNHELWVEKNFDEARDIVHKINKRIHFIAEDGVDIDGVKLWGSAITPTFFNWAWNRNRGDAIKAHWDKIPDDTEILVTHGPPFGILDKLSSGESVGCADLRTRIDKLNKLKTHIFGHIHPGSGEYDYESVKFVNAAIVNDQYKLQYPVRIIEI